MSKNRTIQEVIGAIQENNGFLSRAAKQLGMTYHAIWKRMQKSPELRSAVQAINEEKLDDSEDKLMQAIKNGEPWAICFHLKCKGRHRGWVERAGLDMTIEKVIPVEQRIAEMEAERKNIYAEHLEQMKIHLGLDVGTASLSLSEGNGVDT